MNQIKAIRSLIRRCKIQSESWKLTFGKLSYSEVKYLLKRKDLRVCSGARGLIVTKNI